MATVTMSGIVFDILADGHYEARTATTTIEVRKTRRGWVGNVRERLRNGDVVILCDIPPCESPASVLASVKAGRGCNNRLDRTDTQRVYRHLGGI